MATFDQLSAEQRAIIELVLKQGQSYDQLSDMLGLPVARVRELGRDALVRLSPVSAAAVDGEWRGQLADYLLNQQTGPEATATRGHLRRSEAARGWARSVLDSLEQFYGEHNIPTIPEGERAAEPRRRERKPREPKPPREKRGAGEDRPRRQLSPAAMDAVRRRRLLGAGALSAIVLLAVLVWPIGLVTGGGDDKKPAKTRASAQTRVIGQLQLQAVGAGRTARDQGIAVVAERGGQRQLIVQAKVTPTKNRQAYEVWLYNSQKDARSLGAQVTDTQGTFQGAGPLPDDFTKYRFIDVSLEQVDQNRGHSGNSVLRGRIDQIQAPAQNAGTAPQSTAPQTSTTP
jgi:anti-sigma-K factor RskA/sigma-70-like protein